MTLVRIVAGSFREVDGTKHERGDTVDLSEERLERLSDEKYEVVDETTVSDDAADSTDSDDGADSDEDYEEPQLDVLDEDEVPEEAEAELEEPSYEVPGEYSVLRKMASISQTDEVHGSSAQEDIESWLGRLADTDPEAARELEEQAVAELE